MPKGFLSLRASNAGSLLVLALWSLLLLSTLAVSLAFGARQKISLAVRLEQREHLRTVADAGTRLAAQAILQDVGLEFDSLGEVWASNPDSFREVQVGGGSFTVGYDVTGQDEPYPTMRYGAQDEEQKLNINKADAEVLARLLESVGELTTEDALGLAYAIVDWRDPDSFFGHPQYGAEDSEYRGQSPQYESKDADYEVLEELLFVKGMTPELFERVRGFLTIYGSGAVNANTASSEVLAALGLGESLIEKIYLFRLGLDEVAGTGDEYIFTSPAGIVSALSQLITLGPEELAELSNAVAAGQLGTSSQYFKIQSEGKLATNEKLKSRVICIFKRQLVGGEVLGRIIAWKEEVSAA